MEKLVYTIWSGKNPAALCAGLHAGLASLPELHRLQLNLPDTAFSGGQGPIRNLLPAFDGLVNVWVDSRRQRGALEKILEQHCDGFHGYAASESVPMRDQLPAAKPDGRVDCLSQVCLLRKPEDMPYADWLSVWLDSHTDVAIERQGTIAYVQNIVQAALTADAPPIHGIVEECYPVEAYADLTVFFGAPGDAAGMQANIQALMESTARFAPVSDLDRIFTARYTLNPGEVTAAGAVAEASHG